MLESDEVLSMPAHSLVFLGAALRIGFPEIDWNRYDDWCAPNCIGDLLRDIDRDAVALYDVVASGIWSNGGPTLRWLSASFNARYSADRTQQRAAIGWISSRFSALASDVSQLSSQHEPSSQRLARRGRFAIDSAKWWEMSLRRVLREDAVLSAVEWLALSSIGQHNELLRESRTGVATSQVLEIDEAALTGGRDVGVPLEFSAAEVLSISCFIASSYQGNLANANERVWARRKLYPLLWDWGISAARVCELVDIHGCFPEFEDALRAETGRVWHCVAATRQSLLRDLSEVLERSRVGPPLRSVQANQGAAVAASLLVKLEKMRHV